jgi:hypothetical protein
MKDKHQISHRHWMIGICFFNVIAEHQRGITYTTHVEIERTSWKHIDSRFCTQSRAEEAPYLYYALRGPSSLIVHDSTATHALYL